MKGTARSLLLASILISAIGASACSDEEDDNPAAGGTTGTGGKAATGTGGKAATGTGGKAATTGGTTATATGGTTATATGGAPAATGGKANAGAPGTGGASAGAPSTGGKANAGAPGTGGASAGAPGTGGASAGAPGTGGASAGAPGTGGASAGAPGTGGASAGAPGTAGSAGASGVTVVQEWNFSTASSLETWALASGAPTGATAAQSSTETYCTATGCAAIAVTFATTGGAAGAPQTEQSLQFEIVLATALDLSGAKITVNLQSSAAGFAYAQIYAIDNEPWSSTDGNWASENGKGAGTLSTGGSLTMTLPAAKLTANGAPAEGGWISAGFNPALVNKIGLKVAGGTTAPGATTILIDSVVITK